MDDFHTCLPFRSGTALEQAIMDWGKGKSRPTQMRAPNSVER